MSQEETSSAVVVDRGKSSWSDLWKKEDYWAIWLGFFAKHYIKWNYIYVVFL